ncbi:hypothetical protein LP097_12165 [Moraxella bovis]|uniref:hypothetical protein n=1 Tax=Moraxella bovis TaxID=476 RepID=UPI0022273700|nr:hypothetical protein [Moraxella bovis]UZA29651.1 hypothetical protein LP097_12165 [Moraxella bovis]
MNKKFVRHQGLSACFGCLWGGDCGDDRIFLYLSPLFDSFKTEVEVNPPTKVEPLPQKEQANNYEFYEVLPTREFHTGRMWQGVSQ